MALGAGVTVPPVVAGGTLYILTDDATLIAFR
ncbi:MAG TPA: PQQ-binding-like beta-propeller repeat protein [Alphaproteobacteria bacterium]|nr:PQQ-binding-like beta-propeller repeat protein [Alphaproteobacteria bacterium]